MSVSITDCNPEEQRLLQAAFDASVPYVLVGRLEAGNPQLISIGHLAGLAPPEDYPADVQIYAMFRIKGFDKRVEEPRVSIERKAQRNVCRLVHWGPEERSREGR